MVICKNLLFISILAEALAMDISMTLNILESLKELKHGGYH